MNLFCKGYFNGSNIFSKKAYGCYSSCSFFLNWDFFFFTSWFLLEYLCTYLNVFDFFHSMVTIFCVHCKEPDRKMDILNLHMFRVTLTVHISHVFQSGKNKNRDLCLFFSVFLPCLLLLIYFRIFLLYIGSPKRIRHKYRKTLVICIRVFRSPKQL